MFLRHTEKFAILWGSNIGTVAKKVNKNFAFFEGLGMVVLYSGLRRNLNYRFPKLRAVHTGKPRL